jgi:hypothetical protein
MKALKGNIFQIPCLNRKAFAFYRRRHWNLLLIIKRGQHMFSSNGSRSMQRAFGLALSLGLLSIAAHAADDAETQTLHTNTYRDQASGVCQVNICTATFLSTTSQNTVVNDVTCEFSIKNGLQPRVNLTISGSPDTYFLQTFAEFGDGKSTFFAVNSAVVAHAVKGEAYKVNVETFTITGAAGAAAPELICTISGYHS